MIKTIVKIIVSTVGTLGLIEACFAAAEDPNFALVSPQVKNICLQAAKTPIPNADLPDAVLSKNLQQCKADDFYYGINQPVDFVKARQCAFATHNYGVLTMIYANGKAVAKNWDLALLFACKAGFAPAEIQGRVKHLLQLKNKNWQGADFDICDDVTSGYMAGECASLQQKLNQVKRQQQFAVLSASWNLPEKQALSALHNSADSFFNVYIHNEVDLSGTARAALQIEEEDSLEDELVSSLKIFENDHLPKYSQEQALKIEQQLNQVYNEIENNPDFTVGTVTRLGIKKTQREWLKYQNAWISFGKIKYPQVDETSWKAWTAEKRLSMLQDLAGY